VHTATPRGWGTFHLIFDIRVNNSRFDNSGGQTSGYTTPGVNFLLGCDTRVLETLGFGNRQRFLKNQGLLGFYTLGIRFTEFGSQNLGFGGFNVFSPFFLPFFPPFFNPTWVKRTGLPKVFRQVLSSGFLPRGHKLATLGWSKTLGSTLGGHN